MNAFIFYSLQQWMLDNMNAHKRDQIPMYVRLLSHAFVSTNRDRSIATYNQISLHPKKKRKFQVFSIYVTYEIPRFIWRLELCFNTQSVITSSSDKTRERININILYAHTSSCPVASHSSSLCPSVHSGWRSFVPSRKFCYQ